MRLSLLLLLLGLVTARALSGAPLLPSDTYTLQDGRETLVVARSVWLGGSSLRNRSGVAPTAEACIKACMLDADCDWINWCPVQVGSQGKAAALWLPPHRRCPPSPCPSLRNYTFTARPAPATGASHAVAG